jgi:dihydrolipoamide dehydrogenase
MDLVVVGSGPGGYVAAIRAAQLGLKVACVENAEVGGICTNWGCIPSKALLHSAALLEELEDAADLGVRVENVKPDFERIIQRSRGVAAKNSKGVEFLFKKNKIELVRGTAKLVSPTGKPLGTASGQLPRLAPLGSPVGLTVDGKVLEAKSIIVATGARPKPLPFLEHDGKQILSYKEAMALPSQPKSILIIGAGAIGVEFACFYHACGTKVTLLEALPTIVPAEDEEIAVALGRILQKRGMQVIVGAKLSSVDKGPPVKAHLADRTVEAEVCLLATGVRGNIEGIGLEEAGVKTDRGFIVVDNSYRTSVPDVYAIGDVIGPPMLAHKAMAEGVACVEAIAGKKPTPIDYGAIPGGTFSHPEVASVGLTEKKAKEAGLKFKVGRFPFAANGRARASSMTDGFVKVLVGEPHGELLGAHILGGASTDMLATLTVAMTAELTADEILATVFMHPTFAEAMKGAVEDAYGEAIDL